MKYQIIKTYLNLYHTIDWWNYQNDNSCTNNLPDKGVAPLGKRSLHFSNFSYIL